MACLCCLLNSEELVHPTLTHVALTLGHQGLLSSIPTTHREGAEGFRDVLTSLLAHQVLSQPQQPPTGESEGFKDVLTSAFIGLRFTTKLLF